MHFKIYLVQVCASPEGPKYDAAIKWKLPGLCVKDKGLPASLASNSFNFLHSEKSPIGLEHM